MISGYFANKLLQNFNNYNNLRRFIMSLQTSQYVRTLEGHAIKEFDRTNCCGQCRYCYHKSRTCMCANPSSIIASEWRIAPSPWIGYRVIMALVIVSLWFSSIVETVVMKLNRFDAVMFIYFTYWGFVFLLLTLVLQAVVTVVYRAYLTDEYVSTENRLPWPLILTWVMININTTAALMITLTYWIILYEQGEVDYGNASMHAVNCVLVIMDLILRKTPSQYLHFYQPVLFGMAYVGFSVVYYLCGGTNSFGLRLIYSILNWEKPVYTCICAVLMFSATVLMHLFVSVCATVRGMISAQIYGKSFTVN